MAKELQKLGCQLAYGGTNTHMLLIDLDSIKKKSGVPLKGDIASNILDICGITCNKNALPGDETGARPRGIRFGTTILSQQGLGQKEMQKIARLIYKVLDNIQTFKVIGTSGELSRGKLNLDVIEEVKNEVRKLLKSVDQEKKSKDSSIEIIGERAAAFLQHVIVHDIYQLRPGAAFNTVLLDAKGKIIDEVVIKQLPDKKTGDAHYLIATHSNKTDTILTWLTGLSDGYILFDEDDIYAKIDGPVAIRKAPSEKLKVKNEGSKKSYDLTKPYFIGQSTLLKKSQPKTDNQKLTTFEYIPYEGEPRKTYFYEEHLQLTKKQFMVPFAGWSMPVWYTRASEEHLAVRQAAGLFDVSHMGRFRIKGKYATRFLDLVTTNYVPKLLDGQAHYSYILDADGHIMDDIFLYKIAEDDYILVCNAANAEKIGQWLHAVNEKKVLIDNKHPARQIEGSVTITDIRDPAAGDAQLVNIALQGPNSLKILLKLSGSQAETSKLRNLKKSHFDEFLALSSPSSGGKFGGIWALVTRTGYTGEDIGFEIFVKHTAAVKFWNLLLTEGKEFGIQPCGLAARDSLRTEAGLPLYGHELNGQHKVSATEAGYGSFIKRHKGFFIGRKAYIDQENKQEKEVARFEIKTPGARLIKPDDPISDKKTGHRVGIVTSCTLVPNLDGQSGGKQVGMVHIDQNLIQEGKSLGVSPTRVKRNKDTGIEEKILLDEVTAEIVSRFPLRQETVDF